MASLILPCSGKSTRYRTALPKFLIKNPKMNNLSMVVSSITGLPLGKFEDIYVVILDEHDNQFNAIKQLEEDFKQIDLKGARLHITAIEKSNSAADTISQCINLNKIERDIYIKDCDDYFTIKDIQPNEVCTVSLHNCGKIYAANKSYVSKNHSDLISTIVEKQVISPYFCCGLYSFGDSELFTRAYNHLLQFSKDEEIYISHIIYKLILDGEKFKIRETNNFIDWGTQEDWDDYTGHRSNSLL